MKTYLLGFALLMLAACGGSPLTIPAKDATKMVDLSDSAPSPDAPLMRGPDQHQQTYAPLGHPSSIGVI